LEAAGIPVIDDCGMVVDFHSLRHTFARLGAKAGIPLAVMQKRMRHSDPKLTAGVYTHLRIVDQAAEIAKIPSFVPLAKPEEKALEGLATGTEGKAIITTGIEGITDNGRKLKAKPAGELGLNPNVNQDVTNYIAKGYSDNRDENTENKLDSQLDSQVDGGLSREIGVLKNETINVVGSYNINKDENTERKLGSKLGSQHTDFERKIRTYVNDGSCQKPANFADSGIPGKLKPLHLKWLQG
jgi:hypothetical protein